MVEHWSSLNNSDAAASISVAVTALYISIFSVDEIGIAQHLCHGKPLCLVQCIHITAGQIGLYHVRTLCSSRSPHPSD